MGEIELDIEARSWKVLIEIWQVMYPNQKPNNPEEVAAHVKLFLQGKEREIANAVQENIAMEQQLRALQAELESRAPQPETPSELPPSPPDLELI